MGNLGRNALGNCLRCSCPRGVLVTLREGAAGYVVEREGERVLESADYEVAFDAFEDLVSRILFPSR